MNKLNKKGQAIVEMAVFGTLVLFALGILISYLQQFNDRQYVQMEAFRRALERACTYQGKLDDGAGASVQYTLMQDRHYVNLGGGYTQGNTSRQSGSASVYWAVPKIAKDAESDSLLVFRVNEDQKEINYDGYVPEQYRKKDKDGNARQKYWQLETDNINYGSNMQFSETSGKQENTEGINNNNKSNRKETMTTTIPFTVVEKDKDDESYRRVISQEDWTIAQGAYLNTDSQYKYSQSAKDVLTTREKTWQTPF